jgi:hypothetical protein
MEMFREGREIVDQILGRINQTDQDHKSLLDEAKNLTKKY